MIITHVMHSDFWEVSIEYHDRYSIYGIGPTYKSALQCALNHLDKLLARKE